VAGDDMIDRQIRYMLTTVLASVVVATQNLALGKFNAWARAVNHLFQADDGRAREYLPNSLYLAASIQDQVGFSINNEGNGTAGIADVDRLEIRVENQNRSLHHCL
jgi:hypothetical protein